MIVDLLLRVLATSGLLAANFGSVKLFTASHTGIVGLAIKGCGQKGLRTLRGRRFDSALPEGLGDSRYWRADQSSPRVGLGFSGVLVPEEQVHHCRTTQF